MKKIISISNILAFGLTLLAYSSKAQQMPNINATSPNGQVTVSFFLIKNGMPAYSVVYADKTVIDTSNLGFDLVKSGRFNSDFKILSAGNDKLDESWEMPWGEQKTVRNNYQEFTVQLQESKEPGRKLNLIFRAYDDGFAFRYEFPEQVGWNEVEINEELTQFKLTGDHTCWWQPGDWDIYEHLYNTSLFSEIDALKYRDHPNLAQTYIPVNAVNTPITMRSENGLHLSFHEANLTDYAGMTLKIDPNRLTMQSGLVGSKNTVYKVKRSLPFKTPWRTVQISDSAGGLIESKLILNLNEPNKLGNVSWVKPMKYIGIWWAMHLGKYTWEKSSGKHGATTEHAKEYIDFAAANGFGGVLVEGWNTGWEHWIGFEDREGVFDFVTPYGDYNLEEVVAYGKEKGVEIIMHNETSSATQTYDAQLDTAFALMASLGIHSVKTGYVGKILPKGEYHHGQYMVNHYRRVLEMGAKYKVAIDAHEPIKATGIRRTYPNAISREGLRGQEFNAWAADGGNPPEHLSIIAFTRMLAGPIDFTPGVFNIKLKPYKPNNQVNTTLAQQLALYVVIYSPIQMACDLPEYYKNQPAFQFIRDVGVDWQQSKVLSGEIGEYVVMARQDKITREWFVGGITDENERVLPVDFNFLEKGRKYKIQIYKDGPNAHWNKNPLDIVIEENEITASEKLKVRLASGGGFAMRIFEQE